LTQPGEPYQVGGSVRLREGGDASILAIGGMISLALQAADQLSRQGVEVRVVGLLSVKPIDEDAIQAAARETGAIVTAEDHNRYGGLGGAVAEAVVRRAPVPMEQVALNDTFAESGSVKALYAKYAMTAEDIAAAVLRVLARKAPGRS
ncbi:MAG TPA: transketolase C-terminal domain-containing protein, partial [Anaerolineaceae bacterium]